MPQQKAPISIRTLDNQADLIDRLKEENDILRTENERLKETLKNANIQEEDESEAIEQIAKPKPRSDL